MVILSARSQDVYINKISPELFSCFPDFKSLGLASTQDLLPFIKGVPGHKNKADWLIRSAQKVEGLGQLPADMASLVKLPGIGRKSANVILKQLGFGAEGIIVDIHTTRVAPRIGIAYGKDPHRIEKQLMGCIEQKYWGELGMALTLLGRELCRPRNPKCSECPVQNHCAYRKSSNPELLKLR
jgi:endonuclease-3